MSILNSHEGITPGQVRYDEKSNRWLMVEIVYQWKPDHYRVSVFRVKPAVKEFPDIDDYYNDGWKTSMHGPEVWRWAPCIKGNRMSEMNHKQFLRYKVVDENAFDKSIPYPDAKES